jgi:predicted nucleic acid binding AN1-type Zn finger protein
MTSASASTPTSEIVEFGSHCSRSDCNQLDFLPFRCPYCAETFCGEHWKIEGHSCPRADNRVDVSICLAPVSDRN